MNMKRFTASVLTLGLLVLSGCGSDAGSGVQGDPTCDHTWKRVVCEEPRVCERCGKEGTVIAEHEYVAASCDKAKYCRLCGDTVGEPLGHNYYEGACTTCGAEDPDYFNAEGYGFISDDNMGKWIRINRYGGEYAELVLTKRHNLVAYEFKNGAMYYYDCDTIVPNDRPSDTRTYTIKSNDAIQVAQSGYESGFSFVITERASKGDAFVIKTIEGGYESWFVLEDMIDWERSETYVDPDETQNEDYIETRRYYFKDE